MQYLLNRPELSLARFQRIDKALLMGLQYLLRKAGPGAGSFWSAGVFQSFDGGDLPDIEVYFTPMLVREEAAGNGWQIQNLLNLGRSVIARGKTALPGMQLDIVLLRPRSLGQVRLGSANPLDPPVIDPAYFEHEGDVEVLIRGIHEMREVMRQPAMAEVCGDELAPGIARQSASDIAANVRALSTTGHHPVGSCAMGNVNDPMSVLDENLRVRGFDNLRVVDASSFATQISGTPNAAVIMFAEKAADMILGKTPLRAEPPAAYTGDKVA